MLILDKNNFDEEVLQYQGLILVDYWSESCEPCKALMPDVEELAAKFEGQVKFAKLDASKARRLAISQKVLGLPTITLYNAGEKVEELNKDTASKSNIEAMIVKALG